MSADSARPIYVVILAAVLALAGIVAANSARADERSSAVLYPTPEQVEQAAAALRVLPPPEAPGVIASTDVAEVCGRNAQGLTYSQAHRQTTPAMKAAAHRGIASCGEIDHRLPLALGGADDVRNLWCQPGPPEPWNFHVKDRLEVYVWDAVCHKRTMTLAEGQAVFLRADWRVEFCRLIGGAPCPP